MQHMQHMQQRQHVTFDKITQRRGDKQLGASPIGDYICVCVCIPQTSAAFGLHGGPGIGIANPIPGLVAAVNLWQKANAATVRRSPQTPTPLRLRLRPRL